MIYTDEIIIIKKQNRHGTLQTKTKMGGEKKREKNVKWREVGGGGGWGPFVKCNVGLLITLGLLPSPERTVSQQRS